jgi:hypothetical protein
MVIEYGVLLPRRAGPEVIHFLHVEVNTSWCYRDATTPCNVRRRIAVVACLTLVMMHQQIREAAKRATRFCCFLISGARAWLNYARSLTHNDKDVTRGCFLLYTGYYHNLAAHTGRIRGRTVDSAKENFLGHWYVTSSPVSSRVFTHIGVGSNSGQKDVFCHWAEGQKDNSDTGNRTRALPALRC